MTMKWIGAVLVIVGCSGIGFGIAHGFQREILMMEQLAQLLDFMECELEFRMTPLPQLCLSAVGQSQGSLNRVFRNLSAELENQVSPDAGCCMRAALSKVSDLPESARNILETLGTSLGRFDLAGQLSQIAAVRETCRRELDVLRANKENRVRSCRTLGICAGSALAILFI